MNVLPARQPAPWTMQNHPAYSSQPLYSYEQQQQQAFAFAPPHAPLVSSRHYASAPPPFYPAFGNGYQAPVSQQGHYQQQHSRHAFAGQQQQYSAPPPPYAEPNGFGYSPFYHNHQAQQQREYYGAMEQARASEMQNRGRWQQEATLVGGDLDHPSFDRPPHRSTTNHSNAHVHPQKQAAPPVAAPKVDMRPLAVDNVEYDLISNTSPVPPPPTIELSAVPLADLATEMVWDACVRGINSRAPVVVNSSKAPQWPRAVTKPTSQLFGEVSEANLLLRNGSRAFEDESPPRRQRFTPRTPELYGAIGEGRTRRVSSDGCASDVSSPSSSAPGTPAGVEAIEAVSAKKQRLAGLGFGYGSVGDGKFDDDLLRGSGLDSPVDAIRIHARRLSNVRTPTLAPGTAPGLPAEPTLAFRQFVKSVLTATLLAPEDLVLALYYISSLPASDTIAPLPADQQHSISAQASAIKSAPFKILLGALMIANKTLQDNSYRNETFASVSGIPLKDVNALEVYLFGALKFNVSVRDDEWRTWVGVVRQQLTTRESRELGDRYEVDLALQRLLRAAPAAPACASPSLARPSTPKNSPSALFSLNLDASGPLESPIRLAHRRPAAYEASPTPCSMKGLTYPTSNSRAFGVELAYNRF
ncbi:hypothetical protein RQP46_006503 [Phenoliferia psychrophenolica]